MKKSLKVASLPKTTKVTQEHVDIHKEPREPQPQKIDNSSISESGNIDYQKIKHKPEKLDVESIIAEYNNTSRQKSKSVQKNFPKDAQKDVLKDAPKNITKERIKPQKDNLKSEIKKKDPAPKMILTEYSNEMINSFKNTLQQKFQGHLTELEKQRKTNMEDLFVYLCFGFQEIFEYYKKDPLSMKKLQNTTTSDFLELLKERVFSIDLEILNTHNMAKRNQPTLKLKNQWKSILQMLKQPKNSKLRQAIIIGEVLPSFLVYAREMDLIKYLSEDRQKQLNSEVEGILKNAQAQKDWINFDRETDNNMEGKQKDSLADLDSLTTTDGNQFSVVKSSKSPKRKSKAKRSKPDTRRGEMNESSSSRKLRKLDENY